MFNTQLKRDLEKLKHDITWLHSDYEQRYYAQERHFWALLKHLKLSIVLEPKIEEHLKVERVK